jgi:anti-sigma regulatory factor (Ser/Thr protein kinase)
MTDGTRQVAEDALSLRLTGGRAAAATARHALGRLRGDLDPPVMENMRLLVTELVANSVKHASQENVGLKVLVTQPSVWIEVSDAGPGFEPRTRVEGQDEASGWGLFLVDRLAERWGVVRDDGQTRVWFELRRA